MMKYILSFIFAFACLNPISSQCEIFDLVVDFDPCINGERSFYVNLQFSDASDSFELRGNGNFYGTFAYSDLPIILNNIEPPCGVNMEMVAIDQLNSSCRGDYDLGADLCCECEIFDITYDILDCDDNNQFDIVIDFEHNGPGTSYQISGNGQNYGTYRYDALPLTLGPFDGDCTTNYEFLIEDRDNRDCVEDFSIGEVCCEDECEIRDIDIVILECNGDSCYTLTLNFVHQETGSQFSVSDRQGLIGVYDYTSLPLTIDCFPISGRVYEFIKICDQTDLTCCQEYEFNSEECDSDCVRDLVVEPTDCDSSNQFYVEFDFIHEKVGDAGFCISVNGRTLDTLEYDSIYPRLGPIQGGCDTNFLFRIIDKEFPSCNDSFLLEKTCCDTTPCELWELELEVTDCDTADMFDVIIDFNHARTSDSFILFTPNGSFNYAYTDLPVRVGSYLGDCDNRYNFKIVDFNEECELQGALEDVCCEKEPCELGKLNFDIGDCDDQDSFYVHLNFDYARTSDSFYLVLNRVQTSHSYNDLPVRLGPFIGDCITQYYALVYDFSNECEVDGSFGPVCCKDQCSIRELVVEASECDSNNIFSVDIEFEATGNSDSVCIVGNGTDYGKFATSQIPISISGLEGDCDTKYEFVVFDCENDSCRADYELGEICCDEECEIGKLQLETTDCDSNDMFEVIIDFDYARTSDSFYLKYKTVTLKLAYTQLPVKVGPFLGDCMTEYEFEVIDLSEECRSAGNTEPVCCDEECEIGKLELETTDCDSNDMFEVIIDFDYARTSDSFYLKYKTVTLKLAYSQLPVKVGPFLGDCMTEYEFEVIDLSEECRSAGNTEPVCCDEECEIGKLQLETTDCDSNDMFEVIVDFDYARTSDSFYLKYKTVTLKLAYSQLPVKVGPFLGDCMTEYEFEVIDLSEECRSAGNTEPVCCGEECEINELEAKALECNGDSCLVVELNFNYENTGKVGFDVYDRSGLVGFYQYSQLPLTIDCYPISGKDFEFLKVCDNDNPDCCAEIEFETLDCSGTSTEQLARLGWEINWSIFTNSVRFNNSGNAPRLSWRLYNIQGQPIRSEINQGAGNITLNDLNAGVYILQAHSAGVQESVKIIIQ